MALKPIEIVINAKDKASGVFSSLQANIKKVGVTIAAYFGVKAFADVIEGAADFEQGMSRVQAATGASAADMAKLKQAAQDAGLNTKFTSTEAASALENLGKAGLSAADAIDTLPAVLNLAQAGGVELGASSEYMTAAIAGMGLAFKDAGRVADVLALGANASKTSVEGLAQALSYAAPVAQSTGLSLESTVAILGKMADGAIDASRSGTALSNMLSQFKDPSSTFKLALADAGITTNNFEDALKQLAAAGPKGEKAILAVGLNAGPALRALLNQGMGALDELKAKLDNAAGSAAATAKIMQDNLAGSFKGLSSAWGTVKDVLGTPVLPVLKEGVDKLAGAFRAAVADGTVQRFGESIATAFKSGIQFVRDFISTVDFGAVLRRLQEFATSANETLTKVGEYATNAGNTIKLAYGAMSSGVNVVLIAIYSIGGVFSEMASTVMSGVAKLRDGLASVTFGKLSESFKLAADDARSMAQGFSDAAQAMRNAASKSLSDLGDSAQTARNGMAGLVGATRDASGAAKEAADKQQALNKELAAGADAAAAAGVAYQKKVEADEAAKQAADEHRAAIAKLRAEYDAAVASGSWQQAAEVQEKLNQKLREAVPAAKDAAKAAADAAAKIDAAYKALGIVTDKELTDLATKARANFDLLAASGKASARELAIGFEDAAKKAIAANNGVAPAWVEAQAATRGYRIETDAAGKSTLVLADAVDKAGDAHKRTAGAIGEHMTALEKLNAAREREIAAQEKANQLTERALELYRKKWNIDKDGFTLDANGQRMQQSVPNGNYIYETAKGQGLSEEQALALMDKYFKNGQGVGTTKGSDWFSTVNKAIADAVIEAARQRAAAGPAANKNAQPADAATRSAPAPSGQASSMGGESSNSGGSTGVAVTRVIQLKLDNGRAFGVPTNGQGEDALQGFIQALSYAKSTSAQRHA